ncbi:hypothetical protein COV24_04900, partial [candidate division WWE3 bacterium CG10_big_fil_rev_8_21_14_0_10_32_10]
QPFLLDNVAIQLGPWSGYNVLAQNQNTSTSKRLPLKLIYYEAHLSKEDAKRREKYFKTTKGKATLHQIIRISLQKL